MMSKKSKEPDYEIVQYTSLDAFREYLGPLIEHDTETEVRRLFIATLIVNELLLASRGAKRQPHPKR